MKKVKLKLKYLTYNSVIFLQYNKFKKVPYYIYIRGPLGIFKKEITNYNYYYYNTYNNRKKKDLFFLSTSNLFKKITLTKNRFKIKKLIIDFLGFNQYINNKINDFIQGYGKTMDITGYSRRAWRKSKISKIFLKLGHSYIVTLLVPKVIQMKLTRRRFFFFFSAHKEDLNNFCIKLFKLRPADVYKEAGVRLLDKKRTVKIFNKYGK